MDTSIGREGRLGQVIGVVAAVRRYAAVVWAAALLLGIVGSAAVVFTLALLLDQYLVLPAIVRAVLLLLVIAAPVACAAWLWRHRPARGDEATALLIERRFPQLDNALINALQLARETDAEARPFVTAISDEAARMVGAIRPRLAVSKRTLALAAAATLVGGLAIAAHAMLNPHGLETGAHRVLAPFADNTLTRITDLTPGSIDVLSGEAVTVEVRVVGRVPSEGELQCTFADGRRLTLPMLPKSDALPDQLTASLERIDQNVRYRVAAGDDRSAEHELTVHDRPTVERIVQTITPPDYLQAAPVEKLGGSIEALPGSTVTLAIHSSLPLGSGELQFGEDRQLPLEVKAGDDATVATATFDVETGGRYTIHLTSMAGFDSEPMRYDIALLQDRAPQVSIVEPSEDRSVEIDAELTVEIKASDDHGLREVRLVRIDSPASGTNSSEAAGEDAPDGAPDESGAPWAPVATWRIDGGELQATRRAAIAVAELGLSEDNPVVLQGVGYDRRPDGEPGLSPRLTLRLAAPPDAPATSSEASEKVSLGRLIAMQRTNIDAATAMLNGAAADPLDKQIERQEKIRADAIALGDEKRTNFVMRQKLGDLAETLMVVAIEQLRAAATTGQTAVKLNAALGAERSILKALIAAEASQDDDLASAPQREIAARLADLLNRQKALRADTAERAGSGSALSARQRVLGRDLAVLQRRIGDEASAGAGGNPELAALYREAVELLEKRRVRSSMLIAAERLGDASYDSALEPQDEVIAALEDAQQLLRKQALAEAKEKLQELSAGLSEAAERVEKMTRLQRNIVEIARQLQKAEEIEGGADRDAMLQDLVEAREDMAEVIEQLVDDMHLLPATSASNDLLMELSEIYEDVDQVEGSEDDPVSEIAVDRDEGVLAGLKKMQEEMGERLGDLETWLPDTPDTTTWKQESFDRDEMGEIPLGDLPDALEDIVGDLLEQAEELKQEAQDSASNVGFPDAVMGWDIMDGPMPSWAAKGKSGNQAPNEMEQTGRSGTGRQGMSSGEVVGDTIKALEGSDVEARRTNDAFQQGELAEEDPDFMDVKATGGGKMAGVSPSEGMTGDAPPRNELKYRDLERQASTLQRNAEAVYSKAKLLRLPTGELDRALLELDAAMQRLSGEDLQGFLRSQAQVVRRLADSQNTLADQQVVRGPEAASPVDDATGATGEPIPRQYEDPVAEYMRRIAE